MSITHRNIRTFDFKFHRIEVALNFKKCIAGLGCSSNRETVWEAFGETFSNASNYSKQFEAVRIHFTISKFELFKARNFTAFLSWETFIAKRRHLVRNEHSFANRQNGLCVTGDVIRTWQEARERTSANLIAHHRNPADSFALKLEFSNSPWQAAVGEPSRARFNDFENVSTN